ncbi:MAG TPA: hypothetical protein VGD63_08770 [Steroidobacteraceae bacterium]
MATTFDLSGKSILITGAARGFGRALAIGAAQAGAAVAAFDLDADLLGVQALLHHMDPATGGVVLNLASPTAAMPFRRSSPPQEEKP